MKPNVLYIDAHDLGNWLGCYGKSWIRTPHIDRLASQGARFTRWGSVPSVSQLVD